MSTNTSITISIVAFLAFIGWLCYLSPAILDAVGLILGLVVIIFFLAIGQAGEK